MNRFFIKQKLLRAFTLMELIIYLGLFSFFFTGIMGILIIISRNNDIEIQKKDIQNALGFVSKHIQDSFYNSNQIVIPNTTGTSELLLAQHSTATGSSEIDSGNGFDGTCTISSTVNLNTSSCSGKIVPDSPNTTSTSLTAVKSTSINVTSVPSGLAAGDEILVINLKGTPTNNVNVGTYETKFISSINSTVINVTTPFVNQFEGQSQKVMVQRVPNYTSVTINSGGTMTANAWTGSQSGVLFFRASNGVIINSGGNIDMSSKGYLGQGTAYGPPYTVVDGPGLGGETYNGWGYTGCNWNGSNQCPDDIDAAGAGKLYGHEGGGSGSANGNAPIAGSTGGGGGGGGWNFGWVGGKGGAGGYGTLGGGANSGNITFPVKTDYTTLGGPYQAISGDFNGDGKLDIAVDNNSANSFSTFLNNGNGVFGNTPRADYTTGSGPYEIATGDFNGDGKLDIATANAAVATVSVLLNNGAGSFPTLSNYTTGTAPEGISVGDFNNDGKPDIVTANFTTNNISVLMNTGTGTFAAKVDYTTGSNPFGVVTGDFNGDNVTDIAVTNKASNSISIFLNNGNGTFAAKVDYTAGTVPQRIAAADFNGDGNIDLVTGNTTSNDISVFLNTGTGGIFATKVDYTTDNFPIGIAAGDINNDGKPDIVVANANSNTLSTFLNNGNGTFAARSTFSTNATPQELTLGDYNGDSRLDIAVTNYGNTTLSIFMNNAVGGIGGTSSGGTSGDGGGGGVYGTTDLSKLMMGSAGGFGDASGGPDCTGGGCLGGNGGGIIAIFANSLTVNTGGLINASGANVVYSGGPGFGGGGAGGSILIHATASTLGTNIIRANGGTSFYGGGRGRVYIRYGTPPVGTTKPVANTSPTNDIYFDYKLVSNVINFYTGTSLNVSKSLTNIEFVKISSITYDVVKGKDNRMIGIRVNITAQSPRDSNISSNLQTVYTLVQ